MLAMPDSAPRTLLAFDFGLKQIGIAYGQTLTNSASGLTIIKAADGIPNWADIEGLLQEWKPDLVLVGLPLKMDDSESELSARSRKFARRLQGRFAIQVLMIDERLTSREAKSIIREQHEGAARSRKGKSHDLTKIDHIAASLILQGWFENPEIAQQP
jgi:putative Holliday junction resolvase